MSRNQSPSLSDSFLFQEHPVRAQLDGDQLWFVAKDVCGALGILWTGHSLDSIPECWQRVVRFTTHRRGNQSFKCINEPAVYKLAFRSSKPRAEAFTNWIASEVVPAIRKTGKYEAPKPHPVKKSEQLPLRPAALPALIDEKPFLEFIEEIQAAHEEVKRLLSPLRRNAARLTRILGEQISTRANIPTYIRSKMIAEGIIDALYVSSDVAMRQGLISTATILDEVENPGYQFLGIVRQLNGNGRA